MKNLKHFYILDPNNKINDNYNITGNNRLQNPINKGYNFGDDENSNANEDDINYLKYRTEEMNKELIDKLNKINALNVDVEI